MANQTLNLPLLITRGLIVFPTLTESIQAGRAFSKAAINAARSLVEGNEQPLLFITAQKDPNKDIQSPDDVYSYGTLCKIVNYVSQDNGIRVRVMGLKRVRFGKIEFDSQCGSYLAEAEVIEDIQGDREEEGRLVKLITELISGSQYFLRNIPNSVLNGMNKGVPASEFADILGAYLQLTGEKQIEILKEGDVLKRLELVYQAAIAAQKMGEIDTKLDNVVREKAEKSQKEYYLRERLKAIKDELGEGEGGPLDEDQIREKLKKNPYPQNVKDKVEKELRRYSMMPESSLESSLIMSYIETLMAAPWYEMTEDSNDLENAKKILDEDHYGLEKVKKRIIEYLAVKQTTNSLKAPILCFYGPPGCGKTSLGKSIAKALGRKFFKCSLGGISDENEIRGHRRTYVGSMPGRIIQGMTKTGVKNPVFLLDEIDKLSNSSYKGDPASAMLEVLDPEQNYQFNDNYLEEPYDLSSVLFICTANYLEDIPAPLLDRLELIEVPSYTQLDKMKIAKDFLIKKQSLANGLQDGQILFTEEGLNEIIDCYTRESGVRQLERTIASCCRKAVVEILTNKEVKLPIVIDLAKVKEYLGVEIYEDTKKIKKPQVGVITGLAYTQYGGTILPIEVTHFPGKGGLVLTGKLGDVMKESATIAVDYIRTNAKKYGIDDEIFQKNDIHIHVPEGAVPKDGPSAGVAMTCAVVSCLTDTPADNNVAMTGEVTLRGNAFPIGGLREKSLAALRSGIKTIIVPKDNRKDVDELPQEVKDNLNIIFMECVDDALKVVLLPKEA